MPTLLMLVYMIMWKKDIILLFYIVYLTLFCRCSYISGPSACPSPILYAMFTLSPCLHFLIKSTVKAIPDNN